MKEQIETLQKQYDKGTISTEEFLSKMTDLFVRECGPNFYVGDFITAINY
jgi:hypothetical protein